MNLYSTRTTFQKHENIQSLLFEETIVTACDEHFFRSMKV